MGTGTHNKLTSGTQNRWSNSRLDNRAIPAALRPFSSCHQECS